MNDKEILKWHKLIKEHKATCYIKKNRYKHDSGYGCFEIGYLIEKNEKMKEKIVIGNGTDHIWFYNSLSNNFDPSEINIDVTLDGYIRFWVHKKFLIWDDEEFGYSSMRFKTI